MRAYSAVTAHYLRRTASPNSRVGQGRLELHSCLIGFLPMPGRHFAQDLAKALVFATDRAGITDNVC